MNYMFSRAYKFNQCLDSWNVSSVTDMGEITRLCEEYNVILLEDTCESMGCDYKGKKLGTFGKMSSFSTYFGHHISTIEGGFVSTDDFKL